MADSENAPNIGEYFQNIAKKAFAVDRRAKVTHVAGENRIEPVQDF